MIKAYPQDSAGIEAELMIALMLSEGEMTSRRRKRSSRASCKKYPDTEEKDWINEQLAKMEKK